jgi:putative transposase
MIRRAPTAPRAPAGYRAPPRPHCPIRRFAVYFKHAMTNPHHPHHRRSIRVQGYDYTHPGAYFLTLCTHERLEILGAIVDHEMKLSLPGKIAQQELLRLAKRFPHIRLGEFVVMPNHVHAVIFIVDHDNRAPTEEAFGQPVHGSIPTIVRSYKSSVTWQVNRLRDAPAHPVWQRNYYEHIVRNERDLRRICAYIQTNPERWDEDGLQKD